MLNDHRPTTYLRQRVKDLAAAGIPQRTIARILEIGINTLTKYYRTELHNSEPEKIEQVAQVAYQKALEGNEKMLSYILSRRGNKYGWIDKQITEQSAESSELDDLKRKMQELEQKHDSDY